MTSSRPMLGAAFATLALSVAAEAAAQNCQSLHACWYSAQQSRLADITPVLGEGCQERYGCLKINGKVWPYGPGLTTLKTPIALAVGVAEDVDPMVVPLPADFDPTVGTTVAVQMVFVEKFDTDVRALFSIIDEEQTALVALGVKNGQLFYGRRGVTLPIDPNYPNAPRVLEGWTPVWDPELAPQKGLYGMFFIRFMPSGKVRIDVVWKSEETGKPAWSANLLDVGWPIEKFPNGHEPKKFLEAAAMTIGRADWRRIGSNRMAGGVARIMVFDRPLGDNEMIATAAQIENIGLTDASINESPCNTGTYLSAGKTAPTQTPCGSRWSSLARISIPGEFVVHSGDKYWGNADLGQPVMLVDAKDAARFTASDEPNGRNDFIIRYANRKFALEANGTNVTGGVEKGAPASQYWHMFYGSRTYPQTILFRSLGNGRTIGSTPSSLQLNNAGQAWTINLAPGAQDKRQASGAPSPAQPDEPDGADR